MNTRYRWVAVLILGMVTCVQASPIIRKKINAIGALGDPRRVRDAKMECENLIAKIKDRNDRVVLRINMLNSAGRRMIALAVTVPADQQSIIRAKGRLWIDESLREAKTHLDVLLDRQAKIEDAFFEKYPKGKIEKVAPWRKVATQVYYVMYLEAWALLTKASTETGLKQKQAYDNAADAFEPFIEQGFSTDAIIVDSYYARAMALEKLGKYDDVVKLLSAVKGRLPQSYRLQFALLNARALRQRGQFGKLANIATNYFRSRRSGRLSALEVQLRLEQLRAVVALSPKAGSAQAKLRDQIDKELSKVSEAMAKQVSQILGREHVDLTKHVLKLQHIFAQRQYEQAIRDATNLLQNPLMTSNPNVKLVRYIRNCAYWNLRKFYDAYRDGASFLKSYPRSKYRNSVFERTVIAAERSFSSTATPRVQSEEYKKLLRAYTTQFYKADQQIRLRQALARLLMEQKKYLQAESELKKVIQLDKGFAPRYQYALCIYQQWLPYVERELSTVETKLFKELLRRQDEALDVLYTLQDEDKVPAAQKKYMKTTEQLTLGLVRQYVAMKEMESADRWLKKMRQNLSVNTNDANWVHLRIMRLLDAEQIDELFLLVHKMMRMAKSNPPGRTVPVLLTVLSPLRKERERLIKADELQKAKGISSEILSIYELLVKNVETPKSPLKSQEQAIRYSYCKELEASGYFARATRQYEVILKNTPKDKSGTILRDLANAYRSSKQYLKSIDVWRVLLKGLPVHSGEWFQARYELIRTYQLAGELAHARKLLDFYMMKYPNELTGPRATIWKQLQADLPLAAAGSVK